MLAEKPLTALKDDALGRRRFANRLFRAVRSAPLDWPIRIGVYGRWGSGKTTALNFFEAYARELNWPVIPFNPWSLKTRDEMWEALEREIYEKIIPPDQETARSAAQRGAELLGAAGGVVEAIGEKLGGEKGKEIAAKLRDEARRRLKEFAKRTPDEVAQAVKEVLGERRAVVLIDDLDRAPSEILPEMLLAIPYILSLPQTVFVLALDPTVVGLALKEVHPGWGDGLSFLEKIIDWPRWLPEPTTTDQKQLLASIAPIELDQEVLARVQEHGMGVISTNPRKLKQFLRQLVLVAPELKRMEPEDIHWKTLLASLVMQSEFKPAVNKLLKTPKALHNIAFGRMRELAKGDRGRKNKEDENKPDTLLDSLLGEIPLDLHDRFKTLYEAIRDSDLGILEQHLTYYLSLPDDVPAVTRREARVLIESLPKGTADVDVAALSSFLESRATEAGIDVRDVVSPAVEALCDYRESLTLEIADADLESAMKERGTKVQLAEMVISGVIRIGDERAWKAMDAVQALRAIMANAGRWAHFCHEPIYPDLRRSDCRLIQSGIRSALASATSVADILNLADAVISDEDILAPTRQNIWKSLEAVVPESVAEIRSLIEDVRTKFRAEAWKAFSRSDGIQALIAAVPERASEKLLFGRNGIFRHQDAVESLRSLVQSATTDRAVQANFVFLFRAIAEGCEGGRGLRWVSREEVSELLQGDLISEIWAGATVQSLNPRMWGTIRQVRNDLFLAGRKKDDVIPYPAWAKRVDEELDKTNSKTISPGEDKSGDETQ